MQRLFTTFAGGWPGLGLLVQRLVIGIAMLRGAVLLRGGSTGAIIIPDSLAALPAVFLVIGLWTPISGALIAGVEIWMILMDPENSASAILMAVFSITLAMIGPGAFSIDARLFGRKQISG